ncbi:MAG: NAD(P)/FAD-dependent oxidoreductase [Gammaproteobacteria bacterium]|nr:NAD(P)/FAD-dependent oxidoreductase [Gammaproteobacteria bacterium]
MSATRKIVIIGAGLAGLAAAYALRGRGYAVTVLETAEDYGGRVRQLQIDDFCIDLGANLFFESYGTARHLAEEVGAPLRRTPIPLHSGIYRNGRFHGLYGGDGWSSLWKTARTLLSFRLLSPSGLMQVIGFTNRLKARQDDLCFDNHLHMLDLDTEQSAAEFFASDNGTEALDWLLGPGLTGYCFAHPEQIGAAFAMATLWHTGLNGSAWPCVPADGMGAFVDALASASDAEILLSTPARQVLLQDGAVSAVATDAGQIECDTVICATTATTVPEIVEALPRNITDVLRKVTYSKCCRVFFGLEANPFPPDWYAVSLPRQTKSLMVGMSNAAVLAPSTAPAGKALIDGLVIDKQAEELFMLDDEQVQTRVLAEIRRYFPVISGAPLISHVHHWPQAVCLAPGGSMKALHRVHTDLFKYINGLYLAGDYMGIPSLNAALRSGLDAGEQVCKPPS